MQARLRFTIVDINFAVSSSHSGNASACIISDAIDASRAKGARIWHAFVDIIIAVLSIEARCTATLVVVNFVDTCRSILARYRQAFVNIDITLLSRVAGQAITLKTAGRIDTDSFATHIRQLIALVDVYAVGSMKARLTFAEKFIQCAGFWSTC